VYTVLINCTLGGSLDCTGAALDITGKLLLKPGAKCRGITPSLFVGAGDSRTEPLFRVSGSSGSLDIRDVGIALGKARPGIKADGALKLALSGVQLTNGTGEYGAAVWAKNTLTSITGSRLTGHTATAAGGAIYVAADSSFTSTGPALKLLRAKLLNNEAPAGGAIFVDNAAVRIQTSTVSQNKAEKGGAIYARSTHTDAKFLMTVGLFSYIEYNQAKTGGAFCLNNTRTRVQSSWVRANTAEEGGAFAVVTASPAINVEEHTLSVVATSVNLNTASGNGGGVYLLNARASLSGGNLKGNQAQSGNGGAVYAEATSADPNNFLRVSSTLDSNIALSGGGVYSKDVRTVLQSATLADNNAANDGGGLYVTTGWVLSEAVTISGSTFTRNLAISKGGAACVISTNPESNPAVSMSISSSRLSNSDVSIVRVVGGKGVCFEYGCVHFCMRACGPCMYGCSQEAPPRASCLCRFCILSNRRSPNLYLSVFESSGSAGWSCVPPGCSRQGHLDHIQWEQGRHSQRYRRRHHAPNDQHLQLHGQHPQHEQSQVH